MTRKAIHVCFCNKTYSFYVWIYDIIRTGQAYMEPLIDLRGLINSNGFANFTQHLKGIMYFDTWGDFLLLT